MTPQPETITPEAALCWLAGLETDCLSRSIYDDGRCAGDCNGTGKVPVLDLRIPCPWARAHDEYDQGRAHSTYQREACIHSPERRCPGWLPKQGPDALHIAMHKAGWDCDIVQRVKPGYLSGGRTRLVKFSRPALDYEHSSIVDYGSDADDYIAAYKALRAVGYESENDN